MIEINLIPDVKQELLRTQRVRSQVISGSIFVTFIALGILVVLLIYMFAVQGGRTLYLDGQIKDKGAELAKIDDLSQVLTIQNQLSAISEYNDQKNVTSRVFDLISAVTPAGNNAVSFSRISVGPTLTDGTSAGAAAQGGTIQLEGQTNGFDSMEVFKKTLENTLLQYSDGEELKTVPLTTAVNVGETSYGQDAEGRRVLRFNLNFEYPAELFSSQATNLTFKLNINGNITDSYLNIPRFTERAQDVDEEGEQ